MSQPRKIERRGETGLAIVWDDGHHAEYTARPLRLACRCALCEDEWTGERRLNAAAIPEDVRLLDLSPVGRYGLQFRWSDGHATGIYTFERLRALCECDACAKAR